VLPKRWLRSSFWAALQGMDLAFLPSFVARFRIVRLLLVG
jgi:hypothetical protein